MTSQLNFKRLASNLSKMFIWYGLFAIAAAFFQTGLDWKMPAIGAVVALVLALACGVAGNSLPKVENKNFSTVVNSILRTLDRVCFLFTSCMMAYPFAFPQEPMTSAIVSAVVGFAGGVISSLYFVGDDENVKRKAIF